VHFSVSDYVLDIVHNSIQADASTISLRVESEDSQTSVVVEDDGAGMTKDEITLALNPFYTDGKKHKTRKVGLGLPFLAQAMEATGGRLEVESTKHVGTSVRFGFDAGHLDAPPIGSLVDCFVACMAFDGDYELSIYRRCDDRSYELSRNDLREVLDGFADVGARSLLRQFVESAEMETCGGIEWRR
jgi:hypothetical protein